MTHQGAPACRQRGVTLIETLIALLIFAVGMLGIAGLLSATVKYQSGNASRANVTLNISDIAERIRTNVAASNGFSSIAAGTTTATVGTGYNYAATFATQAADVADPSPDCATTVCTQVQRATYDLIMWRQLLKRTLPGGSGLISGNVTSGFDVTVMWFDKDLVQGNDSEFTDDLQTNQTCSASDNPTAAISRFCCPEAASAPAGVRCYNAKVIP